MERTTKINFLKNKNSLTKLVSSFVFKAFIFYLLILSGLLSTYAADITFSPSSGNYSVGQTFTLNVLVTKNNESINAVSGVISFPTDTLEVMSLSKNGIITMWAEEPSFSKTEGRVSFEGVILNPGYSDTTGKIISITFKAKKSATANIFLKSGSVLANDGSASDVLGSLGSGIYIVNESDKPVETLTKTTVPIKNEASVTPNIISTSYPESTKWYSTKDANFSWVVPQGVTAVRTLYNDISDSVPTKVYDPPINNKSFVVDQDGIQYLHVQFKNSSGWGEVSHYKFMIDSVKPDSLSVSLKEGSISTKPSPTLTMLSSDSLSGIDYFGITVDEGQEVTYKLNDLNEYDLPPAESGNHTATIKAYDKAGNFNSTKIDYTIKSINVPSITYYTKNIDSDANLQVKGSTYPNSKVEIVLANEEGKETSEAVTSNDLGEFIYTKNSKLNSGVYEMRARVVDSNGAMSNFTPKYVIVVNNTQLIRIGLFVMNWLSLILILIIALFAMLATFWFSFVQFSRFRRKVRRSISDVENTLRTNVLALRRDTEEFHTLLVKAEKKRDLTKEEKSIMKKFKKRLDDTEKEIDRKLDNIK